MPKKTTAPKVRFPAHRAEFAGELAPGPVSQSHLDRMVRDLSAPKAVPEEDPGER